MPEYKDIRYEVYESKQWILITGSAASLEKVIRGVAAQNGLHSVVSPAIATMHDYEQDPSKYPLGIDREQIDVGHAHRMAVQTDDGDFFNQGDILLQYLYNDAGESAEAQAAHFEEIKRTFHKVLGDL